MFENSCLLVVTISCLFAGVAILMAVYALIRIGKILHMMMEQNRKTFGALEVRLRDIAESLLELRSALEILSQKKDSNWRE